MNIFTKLKETLIILHSRITFLPEYPKESKKITLTLNIPRPETKPLNYGEHFYLIRMTAPGEYYRYTWTNSVRDYSWLEKGLVYKDNTKKNEAEQVLVALWQEIRK